jgi:hypothetical protein
MAGAMVAALLWLPVLSLTAPPANAQTTVKNRQTALSSAARTSSGNSGTFIIGQDDHVIAFLTVTATTGGTLDVKLQDSPDSGTTWYDLTGTSFAQVTSGSSSQTVFATRVPSDRVRVNYTVAGGGFTFAVHFISYKGSPTIVSSTDANASNLTAGAIPLARIVDLTNTQVSATAAIAASKLAEDAVRTATVTVATGSVLTLNATPVSLIAAPGAGKAIVVDGIVAKIVFNSVAYTGGNALEFRYTNGSGAKVTADIASSFINSASGTTYASVAGVTTSLAPVVNAAVVVFVPVADPGAGNSPIVFTVRYHVVTP